MLIFHTKGLVEDKNANWVQMQRGRKYLGKHSDIMARTVAKATETRRWSVRFSVTHKRLYIL